MNINIDLLFFDYIVLCVTMILIFFGFLKGFINSILGLLTWVGSVFITIYLHQYFSQYLTNLLLNIEFLSDFEQFVTILSLIVSIPLIFLLSLFLLKRVRKIISSDLDKQVLGLVLDKFFGALFGLVFSYVIYSTLLYFTYESNFDILNNLNIFMIENSNLLNKISSYNQNIIGFYNMNDQSG